jgi:hypothetical protein
MTSTNLMTEEYSEQGNGKIICNTCVSLIQKTGWKAHTRTQKHQKYLSRYSNKKMVTTRSKSKSRAETKQQRTRGATTRSRARIQTRSETKTAIDVARNDIKEEEKKGRAMTGAERMRLLRARKKANPSLYGVTEVSETAKRAKRALQARERRARKKAARLRLDPEQTPEEKARDRGSVKAKIDKLRRSISDNLDREIKKITERTTESEIKIIQDQTTDRNKNILHNIDTLQSCEAFADALPLGKPGSKQVSTRANLRKAVGVIRSTYSQYTGKAKSTFDCKDFSWLLPVSDFFNFFENVYKKRNGQPLAKGSIKTKYADIAGIMGRIYISEDLRAAYKSISDRAVTMNEEIQKQVNRNEGENTVDWKELVAGVKSDKLADKEQTLLSMYTMVPPRRAKDYRLMKLMRDVPDYKKLSKDFNYLIINSKTTGKGRRRKRTYKIHMQLNVFKTSKYGSFYRGGDAGYSIPKKLKTRLIDYTMNMEHNEFLFQQSKRNHPLGEGPYRDLIRGIIKKVTGETSTGTNTLRHSFTTFIMSKQGLSVSRIEDMSEQVGNSLKVFMQYNRLGGKKKRVVDKYLESLSGDAEEVLDDEDE